MDSYQGTEEVSNIIKIIDNAYIKVIINCIYK